MSARLPASPSQLLSAVAGTGRRAGSLLVAAATLGGTLAVGVLGAAPAGAGSSDFVSCINSARAANGLRALSASGDLAAVAQSWSGHMAAAGGISHNPGLTSQVSNWQVVGENVGMGPTTGALCNAFMNSPAHRDNILDSEYTQVGVGTVVANGTIFVTEDFRKPSGGGSAPAVSAPQPAPAPQRPAAAPVSAEAPAAAPARPDAGRPDPAPAANGPAAAPPAPPAAPPVLPPVRPV
ncbi:MAG: CAP domain-containing protein, partial [Actinomycetota bacterium]|nr:CAP domain-containing protein [Actinomycetota bacterium]